MVHVRDVRKVALALPEASEEDHFGKPSFRVRGRIFATLPDFEQLNVMIDPFDVDAVTSAHPLACRPLLWGKEVRGATVELRVAQVDMVRDLLVAAWRRKAPQRRLTKSAP